MSETRKTRIICTLGPATESPEMLRKLIEAGADVFRLNMSHARHDWCRKIVPRIRAISEEVGRTVGVLFDLQGPSIRTGDVEEKIALAKGDRVEFRVEGAAPQIEKSTTVNYPGLMSDVSEGDELTVDNGELLMKIEKTSEDRINPLSPPCIPPKFVLHGLSSKSKFLAVSEHEPDSRLVFRAPEFVSRYSRSLLLKRAVGRIIRQARGRICGFEADAS